MLSGIAGMIAFPHLVASSALGKAGTAAASERVATGAIGVGGRGRQILQALMGRPDCRMLAVCDVDSRRLDQARDIVNSKYGNADCAAYADYRELLIRDDIDAVLIASPDHWHVLQSVEAARAGKDMFTEETHLANSSDHAGNFLDCVKSRRTPVSSIDSAVRTDTVCHLSDIAMRLSRRLRWDPKAERFIDDDQANRMLSRAMRSPWHLWDERCG
jgi:hypothetical protein